MRSLLMAVVACLLFITCKKEDSTNQPGTPNNGNPNTTKNISILNTSAVPGEVVVAQANFELGQDSISVKVAGKTVIASPIDSNRIVFILPELASNSTASIQYQHKDFIKQLDLTVGSYASIAQPDAVINNFISRIDSVIQSYQGYENDLFTPLDPAYSRLMIYARDNFKQKISTISADEKKQVAYTIQAYPINAQESRMEKLNSLFFARTEATTSDPSDDFKQNSSSFLTKTMKAKLQVTAGMGIMLYALSAGPFGVPIALGGAYIFLDGVKKMADAQAASYNKSLNSVVERTVGSDITNKVQADSFVLVNDIKKRASFKGAFRTLAQSDALSSAPAFKDFFQGKGIFDATYNSAVTAYEYFKRILGGSAPAYPAPLKQIRTTSATRKVTMMGAKLSLENISNAAISLTFQREDTTLLISATSTTISQPTQFSFDLVYNNTNTGTKVIDKINAVFTAIEGVTIGTQTWMKKNLDVATFRNGDTIPQIKDSLVWAVTRTPAWCYYKNDPSTEAIYGKLYNFYAVKDSRGLAPKGWHVPDTTAFEVLFNYLGGLNSAASALSSTQYWSSPNNVGNNSSGFNAVPAGFRDWFSGMFSSRGSLATFWTNSNLTTPEGGTAWVYYFATGNPIIKRDWGKWAGLSVRCIKD